MKLSRQYIKNKSHAMKSIVENITAKKFMGKDPAKPLTPELIRKIFFKYNDGQWSILAGYKLYCLGTFEYGIVAGDFDYYFTSDANV